MINNTFISIQGMFKCFLLAYFCLFQLSACQTSDKKTEKNQRRYIGEYIYRNDKETAFLSQSPQPIKRQSYPWEVSLIGNLSPITKEYFRCKGSSLNPIKTIQKENSSIKLVDCAGNDKHSLPLKNNKEFIYPILIDLLNYIQLKTKNRVIITSGHRCPEHNRYCDASEYNQCSKHQIGAEVSFYVQTLEYQPQKIIDLLIEYFKNEPSYAGKSDYQNFNRWEKNDTNTSIAPWYNQEVFIKYFKKNEGRNYDNRHPYPYISIQVRNDKENNSKVNYTWDLAWNHYLRY